VATKHGHRGRSIVQGMLDLDDVSPDGYNVQGLHHAGRTCTSFEPKEPPPIKNFKQLYLHTHWKLDTCLY